MIICQLSGQFRKKPHKFICTILELEIMENVNRLNINNEIESAIKKKKKTPNKQNAAPSQVNYTNTEEKLTSIFLQHLQKIRGKNVSELIL